MSPSCQISIRCTRTIPSSNPGERSPPGRKVEVSNTPLSPRTPVCSLAIPLPGLPPGPLPLLFVMKAASHKPWPQGAGGQSVCPIRFAPSLLGMQTLCGCTGPGPSVQVGSVSRRSPFLLCSLVRQTREEQSHLPGSTERPELQGRAQQVSPRRPAS